MKHLSKILSVLLCLAMVLGMFAMTASAAGELTATLDSAGTENKGAFPNKTIDKVTFTAAKNDGNNAPLYYTSGEAFRFYGKNTLTISVADGYEIVSIVITCKSTSNLISNDNCAITNATATGLGTSTVTLTPESARGDVVLTNPKSSGNFRITTCTVTYKQAGAAVAVTGVTVAPATVNLKVGEGAALSAAVAPDNATEKAVTWKSSDETVVTVDNAGNIFALKAGSATITATSSNNKSGSCAVTVAAADLLADKANANATFAAGDRIIIVEETKAVAMTANDDSGKRFFYTNVVLSGNTAAVSSKLAVLTLEAGSATGTFKLKLGDKYLYWVEGENQLKAGTPDADTAKFYDWVVAADGITAANKDAEADVNRLILANPSGGYFSAYKAVSEYCLAAAVYKVRATTVNATGVTLDKTTANLTVGNELTLTATVTPANSTDSITWTTSDASIATVANGKVKALKAGTVTITAKAGSKSAACTITVTAPAGSGNGNTDETVKTELTVQNTPTAGKSYKYGLYQGANKTQLWFTGEMSGYYLAMSEDVKDAVDVTVEAVDGGYRLSFTKDGVKKYIDIVERTDKAGSANVVITDEPTAVLTWDATAKTFFAKIGENTFYLGTYNNFKTISASNISYITGDNASKLDVSQYVSHLYLDEPSSTGDAFEPMVIILALAAVSALAVLTLNRKKFSF